MSKSSKKSKRIETFVIVHEDAAGIDVSDKFFWSLASRGWSSKVLNNVIGVEPLAILY